MDVETSSSPSLPTEKALVNVHLFNCDRTYKLESVEKLLRDVEANAKCEFSISKHYFPLPKMAETCVELTEYQMDFAVFVVHANESRLSLNEERAGIGYAKIYRALLDTTGYRVLIVIGGDEYYEGEEDTQVLSRWAKLKILSQFSPEYLNGRKSFVFSWETKHRYIHEDALLHFLDPEKQGQMFVPEVRSAPEPEQFKTEIPGSEETAKTEEKLGPQTDSKDSLVSPNAATQQNIGSVEASTTSSAPSCTSKDERSFKQEQGGNGFEEEKHVCETITRHDEVNEGITAKQQSSKTAEENNKVCTFIIGYNVRQKYVSAAKTIVHTVGEKLNLTPLSIGTIVKSANELTMSLAITPKLSSSNFVILVVKKSTITMKDNSPFLDLLKVMRKGFEGRQVAVIVCKDRDWEAGQNMLVSPSVKEHARQFKQHVDHDNWIVYSWNEKDENFNTQSHEDDLVKKTRNWFEKHPLQATTGNTEVVNRATTESQNVSTGAELEKVEHSDCPTYRTGGGLLRMTVRLEHGEIKEAVQKFPKNWEPPQELISGIKKLFHDTPFIDKAEIWEEKDGSHSIKKEGKLIKIVQSVKKRFTKM